MKLFQRCPATREELERGAPHAVQAYVRARMHRRIFLWFGASIVMTAATVMVVLSLFAPDQDNPAGHVERWERFIGHHFAELWHQPETRDALARGIAADLDLGVRLEDTQGSEVSHFGPACPASALWTSVVTRDGEVLGRVIFCRAHAGRALWAFPLVFIVSCATLWAIAGIIARRIAQPITQVASVARAIGEGDLGARVQLESRHRVGEVRVLSDSINEMAVRIQRQLSDQRELLAAVSHELRTPLGHIRILLEMIRDQGAPARMVDELEREVLEVDDLVGELLASSRLSFDALTRRPIEGLDVAARALERRGLSLDLLHSDADAIPFVGDATLLGRALANLLENAERYGGGACGLNVDRDGGTVVFRVVDRGPGFAAGEADRVFESFFRGESRAGASHASLGLGLSLVRRIAEAHGGRAWARNREDGGAEVSFSVALELPAKRPALPSG